MINVREGMVFQLVQSCKFAELVMSVCNKDIVVTNKLFRAVGILCKLKHVLPHNAVFKLYYSLFHPQLLYGLVAWGFTFPTYLHKLASIQNKAVKLIGGGHFLESSTHFYAKLKILQLLDLYKFETVKLVHDYMNSKLPLSFPII